MNRGIYVALSGTLAQEKRLDVLTNNLANINTPGFKKDKTIFKVALPPLENQNQGEGFMDKVFVEPGGINTDYSAAPYTQTGNPLDLAISGDGFFEVMTPQGVRFTRDGSFRRNEAGELVTGDGYQVMGEGGPIRVGVGDVKIEKDGSISVNGAVAGRIKTVDFPKPYPLRKEMENLYAASDSAKAVPSSGELKQGYVEGANVSVIREMTAMIDVMRSYESYIKMMQSMDEATGKVINEVGRV